jgi:hypothetical protein
MNTQESPSVAPAQKPYAPREEEALARVHLWLYARDVQRLKDIYGSSVGVSKAARLMIRKFLNGLEARAAEEAASPGQGPRT